MDVKVIIGAGGGIRTRELAGYGGGYHCSPPP